MNHLPTLLALSANSPFWNGRATGLHSQRVKVMEGLPTAGLPPLMRNWSEYLWLIDHMVETGFIRTTRESGGTSGRTCSTGRSRSGSATCRRTSPRSWPWRR